MKKILLFVILLIPFNVSAISASSAIVMDLNSSRIIYEANIHEQRLIASITKIMTCIVTIENVDIDKKVKVDEDVLKAFGSAIYIEVGEELTIKDLLMGLMLRSGNDAAIVLAKNVAGSMDEFVYLMNELASNIGMKDTIFYNNHGLDEGEYKGNISTAYDMALLTKYAMNNKTFRNIFKTKEYITKSSYKTYKWKNKNKLLHRYDYITGGKTGFTKKARRTLVTTASKNNINLVIVTLNDPNDFQDHITLYENAFNKYKAQLVLDKKNFKIKKDTFYKNNILYIKHDYYLPIKDDELKDIKIKYVLTKNKHAINNDIVGQANIYLNNKIMHKANIYFKKIHHKKKSFLSRLSGWLKNG